MSCFHVDLVLAEDDPDDRYLIERALRELRPQLTMMATRDGAELLEYLHLHVCRERRLPRLVLLDLNMPRMDGRESLHRIKSDFGTAVLPVVVLTTSIEPEDRDQAYRAGAVSVIRKPDGYRQLVESLGVVTRYWLDLVEPTEAHLA